MPIFVIDVDLIEDDGSTVLISVRTTAGAIQIMGECEPFDRDLVLDRAHIQGLYPGALGRQGLNEVAQRIMEIADVDTLEIHGSTRSTGRNVGRLPKRIFARRRVGP